MSPPAAKAAASILIATGLLKGTIMSAPVLPTAGIPATILQILSVILEAVLAANQQALLFKAQNLPQVESNLPHILKSLSNSKLIEQTITYARSSPDHWKSDSF